MRKFLKMQNTVMDMKTNLTFVKDRLYEIVNEYENRYLVANQYGVPCCIGREGEGINYIVVEME